MHFLSTLLSAMLYLDKSLGTHMRSITPPAKGGGRVPTHLTTSDMSLSLQSSLPAFPLCHMMLDCTLDWTEESWRVYGAQFSLISAINSKALSTSPPLSSSSLYAPGSLSSSFPYAPVLSFMMAFYLPPLSPPMLCQTMVFVTAFNRILVFSLRLICCRLRSYAMSNHGLYHCVQPCF